MASLLAVSIYSERKRLSWCGPSGRFSLITLVGEVRSRRPWVPHVHLLQVPSFCFRDVNQRFVVASRATTLCRCRGRRQTATGPAPATTGARGRFGSVAACAGPHRQWQGDGRRGPVRLLPARLIMPSGLRVARCSGVEHRCPKPELMCPQPGDAGGEARGCCPGRPPSAPSGQGLPAACVHGSISVNMLSTSRSPSAPRHGVRLSPRRIACGRTLTGSSRDPTVFMILIASPRRSLRWVHVNNRSFLRTTSHTPDSRRSACDMVVR